MDSIVASRAAIYSGPGSDRTRSRTTGLLLSVTTSRRKTSAMNRAESLVIRIALIVTGLMIGIAVGFYLVSVI